VKSAVVNYISNPNGSNLVVTQFNTSPMAGKLDINTITCPIENLYDKSGKFAALGKPEADRTASSLGGYSWTYTIIGSSEDHTSNDPDQQSAPVLRNGATLLRIKLNSPRKSKK
jgi:hypothetical protein